MVTLNHADKIVYLYWGIFNNNVLISSVFFEFFSHERLCNAIVTRLMIMWSNRWSSTWSNIWLINIIFLRVNKPYLHFYQNLSLSTYHPSSETNINPILIARRSHYQLIDQYRKTSTNITITLIDAIYKEFYKCWSSYPACASAHSKTLSQTYKSLIKPLACVSTHSNANAFPIR